MTTLNFHKDIYTIQAIERSIEVFSAHGNFSSDINDDYIRITVESSEEVDTRELVGEFANYVLVETVESDKN